MATSMKVEDRLNEANNFRSWKHRVMVILEEYDLLEHITEYIPVPEGDEEKLKFKKDQAKVKRILTESIKDNLIPYITELKKPKEMFDALTRLYESKNTSRKLTLTNQLRITKMGKSNTISSYFMFL